MNSGEDVIKGIAIAISEDGHNSSYEVTVESVSQYIDDMHTYGMRDSIYDHDQDVYAIKGISNAEISRHLKSLGYIHSTSSESTCYDINLVNFRKLAMDTLVEIIYRMGDEGDDIINELRISISVVFYQKIYGEDNHKVAHKYFNKCADNISTCCNTFVEKYGDDKLPTMSGIQLGNTDWEDTNFDMWGVVDYFRVELLAIYLEKHWFN